MEFIKVMISSTVEDLKAERDAIRGSFSEISFVKLLGADPFNATATPGSSGTVTIDMARECDLYILILGNKYGFILPSGKSATEIEYDNAFKDDPTKILVFKKNTADPVEQLQQIFIDKVCNYYHGYWRTQFNYSHKLKDFVGKSFIVWLKNRASLGDSLNYLDHFVRLAKQRKPEPTAQVFYRVTSDIVELEYVFFGNKHVIHFTNQQIYTDFWGCLFELEAQFSRWT